MPILCGMAMMLQDADASRHDLHLLTIFVGLIAISLVVAAVGMVVVAVFGAKLLHRVDKIANIVEAKTGPILEKTNTLITELGPKIHGITANAEHLSYTLRDKVEEIGVTVSELNLTVQEMNGRTRRQVARFDGIVSGVMGTTEEVAVTIQEGIKGPVKQIAGIVAGLRVGLETLVARSPFGR